MKMHRVFVNNLTIVGLLSVCGSLQSLYLGEELHAQIIKNSMEVNLQSGGTLVWFYCKCGEYTYAARILEVMPGRDAVSWTAVISGYNNLGHNVEALKSLHDMLCDGSSLIDMYMRCGKVNEARRVFDAMPDHNLVTWKVIITGFSQNGLCEEALKHMYLMQQEGHEVDDFVLSTAQTSCGDLQWESISFSGSVAGSVFSSALD
ncbi:pentatricopeptide repeat-containing protein At4g18520, chloroplastic-like [Oryza brachyantha]|uniref:Uncharacterized protein n=1 Tax=Oryza brachyantha TaxID=4533 RepID=J3LSW8_ORYBR|nr:pentatricopeptide repeat-containing protein At4g18520, chloroplastic-like [Oryza brachyantha]